jgi:hypothetical protein
VDGGVWGEAVGSVMGQPDDGCAFILGDGGEQGSGPRVVCGQPRRPASPYCADHHALCHIAEGSGAERRQLKTAEALAKAVGGRRGKPGRVPPDWLLRRWEKLARDALRPSRSRIVQGEGQ